MRLKFIQEIGNELANDNDKYNNDQSIESLRNLILEHADKLDKLVQKIEKLAAGEDEDEYKFSSDSEDDLFATEPDETETDETDC